MISFKFYTQNKNLQLIYKKCPHFSKKCPVCAVHGFSHVWCGILFIFDHSQLKDCTNKQKCGPFFRIYSKLENLQFKTVNKTWKISSRTNRGIMKLWPISAQTPAPAGQSPDKLRYARINWGCKWISQRSVLGYYLYYITQTLLHLVFDYQGIPAIISYCS